MRRRLPPRPRSPPRSGDSSARSVSSRQGSPLARISIKPTSELARASADAIAAEQMRSRATLRAPIAGCGHDHDRRPRRHGRPVAATDRGRGPLGARRAAAGAARTPPRACTAMRSSISRRRSSDDAEALGTATVAEIGGTIDSAARAVIVRARVTHPARQLRVGRDGVRADRARGARERVGGACGGARARRRGTQGVRRRRRARGACDAGERRRARCGLRRDHVGAARRRDGGDVRRVRRRRQREGDVDRGGLGRHAAARSSAPKP